MAAPAVYRRPCDVMTVRSLETDGRSRRRRVGWCGKDRGRATMKSFGSKSDATQEDRRSGANRMAPGLLISAGVWPRERDRVSGSIATRMMRELRRLFGC